MKYRKKLLAIIVIAVIIIGAIGYRIITTKGSDFVSDEGDNNQASNTATPEAGSSAAPVPSVYDFSDLFHYDKDTEETEEEKSEEEYLKEASEKIEDKDPPEPDYGIEGDISDQITENKDPYDYSDDPYEINDVEIVDDEITDGDSPAVTPDRKHKGD